MGGAATTIASGDAIHRGLELPHSKAATRGPRVGDSRNGNGNIRQYRIVGDIDLRQIWILVRIVRYHQNERSELRLNGAESLCQFHAAERTIILEIATVDDAIDDLMLTVTDFTCRGNDWEACGIMSGGAQAYVIKLTRREERQVVAHI